MVQFLSVRGRILTAVAVLGAGAAYAGFLYSTPVQAGGSDISTIRALSQRLSSGSEDDLIELRAPAALPVPPPADPPAVKRAPAPSPRVAAVPVQPAPRPVPPAPEITVPSSPVQNIALMGVTNTDGAEKAWLVDVATQEREVVDEGDAAWGFTVQHIGDEQIVLARGTDEFTIRLGEKDIPVNETPAVDTTVQAQNNRFGGWGGNRGNRSSGRSARRMARQAAASSGGRSWGGRSSSGNSGSSNWNRNNRSRSSGGRSFSGGFTPRFNGSFGGGNRNRNQTQAAGPTSNPQTARRRGGQLVGGAEPLPTPAAISNPQTLRRLGTTSGAAFGTSQNQSRNQNQGRSRGR